MKKHILYIHQYFKTPEEPGGTRSYWFSKELIRNGLEVTIITSRNKQEKKIEIQQIDGIKVIYIKNAYYNNMPPFQRIISFFKFMIYSTTVALRQKNIDLVFATSTPLTVGLPALVMKIVKRKDYIFEVRDLWPEFPIQIGVLKNKLLQKVTRWFEKTIYRNALHVIALSPGMKEGVVKYIKSEKVSVIPNMSKKDEFFPHPKNYQIAGKFSLDLEKFNVIHFGAMGKANGLDYLIDAAKIFKEKNIVDVEFIFLGEGMTLVELKSLKTKYNLNNVKFLGAHPMLITSEIVNLCDCSIVSFMNLPILRTNSPNKLFDSLSAGKPIIVNSNGWTRKMVEGYNCGIYVDPKKPESLYEGIVYLKNNPAKSEKMGENARNLAENKFDKSILSKDFVDVIKKYL